MVNCSSETGSGIYVSIDELIALQKPGEGLCNAVAHIVQRGGPGAMRSFSHGRGYEPDELRGYQIGDDMRAIDWRVTARCGRMMTRLFTEDREQQYLIAADQRPPMFFGSQTNFKSVTAAHCAALFAWAAFALGARIGGVVAGENLSVTRDQADRHSVLKLLRHIAAVNQSLDIDSTSEISLVDILQQCLQSARSGSMIVLISDFTAMDQQTEMLLAALCRRGSVLLVRIVDQLQEQLPVAGSVGIGDGQQRASVRLNAATRAAYKESLTQKNAHFTRTAERYGASMVIVSTMGSSISELQAAISCVGLSGE
ncbi:hypothetical protein AB833_19880 [Chromatiales bacterium (ex Bugula neritina AB1)]|nr:hypothetical protein AB833_19880 [Chromatiales bacterium (ex Bugula neritina AB1)]